MFGADSLSETERCIATRQNKMAAPNVVSARFILFLFSVLGRSGLCINDHRTQNQSLKQAPLVFYEKFPVGKSCHFGSHFRKRSHQTNRCIARTNRYRALHESAFLMQLTPGMPMWLLAQQSLSWLCNWEMHEFYRPYLVFFMLMYRIIWYFVVRLWKTNMVSRENVYRGSTTVS